MKHFCLNFLITSSLVFPAAVLAARDPDAGAAIYNKTCKMCHATGMMNAPKVGDRAAWEDRVAKGEEALLESTIKGINKMPARGNCTACSDDDLRNAIAHMLDQSQ